MEQATKNSQMERELAHELKDTDQEHRFSRSLGELSLENGPIRQGLKYFNEQLVLSPEELATISARKPLSTICVTCTVNSGACKGGRICRNVSGPLPQDPDFPLTSIEEETLNSLGEVYRASGQYAKAVEFYERGLEIRRNSPGLLRKSKRKVH